MRFLVDENLSPRLADHLRSVGHNVVHVRELGLTSAADAVILEAASTQNRVIVSADTDFGTLLARSRASTPSLLLLRRIEGRRASEQAALILDNLDAIVEDLLARGRCCADGAVSEDSQASFRVIRADNRSSGWC